MSGVYQLVVLVRVSMAAMRKTKTQKQVEENRVLFGLHSQVTVHPWGKSEQELQQG